MKQIWVAVCVTIAIINLVIVVECQRNREATKFIDYVCRLERNDNRSNVQAKAAELDKLYTAIPAGVVAQNENLQQAKTYIGNMKNYMRRTKARPEKQRNLGLSQFFKILTKLFRC